MPEKTVDEILESLKESKARLPKGPWTEEPDRELFKAHGFQCLINRNAMGAWCGYVGVPPGHPWHGKSYDDVEASVHGGLTYANECAGHICHVPEPEEKCFQIKVFGMILFRVVYYTKGEEHLYWLGFDCSHAGDLTPGLVDVENRLGLKLPGFKSLQGEKYRNLAYVKAETKQLAKQAAEAR